MEFPKTPIKDLSFGESGTGLNNLSPSKESYGVAAFSLASLDQGGRSSGSNGSMINLSQFDPTVFLKSGSFDSLHTLLGSQFFKSEADKHIIPPLSASLLNNSATSLTGLLPSIPTSSSPSAMKSLVPTSIPSNVISSVVSTPMSPMSSSMAMTHMQPQITAIQPMTYGNALIQPKEQDKRITEKKDENSKFVDVTPFLTLPQHEAAKKLGIPSSTLAKRWKEASCNRKWPYRTVSKLDKEILTLLKNVESAKAELSPSVEATLGLLLKKRNEELKTVLVRL